MLTLHHNDMSVCAQKVRMVLAEKNIEWTGPNLNLRAGDQYQPDFLKLNPKAVVPVIEHDGNVITESNAIIEYLDEAFPEPPLMPADAAGRATVRNWLIQLDAGLHVNVARLSFAIAFRHQVLAAHKTAEDLEAHIAKAPTLELETRRREHMTDELESPRMKVAVAAYEKLLADMERVLSEQEWLVGDRLSLADFGYAPYITRLEHLQLRHWWDERSAVRGWLERIKATRGYIEGVAGWNNPNYLSLMKDRGEAAWSRVAAMIAETSQRS